MRLYTASKIKCAPKLTVPNGHRATILLADGTTSTVNETPAIPYRMPPGSRLIKVEKADA